MEQCEYCGATFVRIAELFNHIMVDHIDGIVEPFDEWIGRKLRELL